MTPLTFLENGLFALGQTLRFPVMALLWLCVGTAIVLAASCCVEAVARRRERQAFDIARWLDAGPVLGAAEVRRDALPASLRQMVGEIERARADGTLAAGTLEHLVIACEDRLRRSLSVARMLVKVGPSLGLLGTLIPMGVSLAALAAGNLQAMAGEMVVAFTSTIVGLATGTVAFVVASVRHNWVTDTVREQRYLAERILHEIGDGVA